MCDAIFFIALNHLPQKQNPSSAWSSSLSSSSNSCSLTILTDRFHWNSFVVRLPIEAKIYKMLSTRQTILQNYQPANQLVNRQLSVSQSSSQSLISSQPQSSNHLQSSIQFHVWFSFEFISVSIKLLKLWHIARVFDNDR